MSLTTASTTPPPRRTTVPGFMPPARRGGSARRTLARNVGASSIRPGNTYGRFFGGVGEAVYGASRPSLLADLYSRSVRGEVFAVFFLAIPVGSALGYLLGGLLEKWVGWRMAFWVAGLPGRTSSRSPVSTT